MIAFKALSALLTFPSADLQVAIPEVRATFGAHATALAPLLTQLESEDITDLQESYVLLFDRSRTLSPNLFEHIHGESRDRGGAMVDLLETYRAAGFDLTGTELPDHLPVLREFLSTQTPAAAPQMLADAGHILVALAERLLRRERACAAVMRVLVAMAQAQLDTAEAQILLAETDDNPEDLAALDAVWTAAQVTLGPDPNAGCPVSRDILARMAAPVVAPAAAAE